MSEITSEWLVGWLSDAEVDKFEKPYKIVFVAKKQNEILYFTCYWREENYNLPNIHIVWSANGESINVHQNLQTHSVGLFWGERIEELFVALHNKVGGYTSNRDL
jgi:hypothetical protein